MKKIFLLLIILNSCVNFLPGQNGFLNINDAKNTTINGLKEGNWIEYVDSMTFFDSGYTAKENANWYYLCTYKAGRPYGISRVYLVTGVLVFEGESSNFPLLNNPFGEVVYNGICKWFMDDTVTFKNHILAEASYLNGKIIGITNWSYSNYTTSEGKIIWTATSSGTILQKQYFENGQLKMETPYVNGIVQGIEKEYTETGNLIMERKYIDGVLAD